MKKDIHVKYLPANNQDFLWGLTISSVGCQRIEMGESYPPDSHPTRYLFSADRGRVLNEYQLLYIIRGRGVFSSASHKKIPINEGDMFLLFPGEWHSYKPDAEIGWDEYWIGFNGINMDNRLHNDFFSRKLPVFKVGIRDDIVGLYNQAINIAKEQKTGYQQMLAGIVDYLLGLAYSQNKYSLFEDLKITKQINQAKVIMLENFHMDIKPQEVARQVNMSYSWFRHVFKQYIGFSPSQYIQELKIQKSKELLTCTNLTSQEIAFEVGFNNPDYYNTVFKKKIKCTPIEYRKITQGKSI